MENSQYSCGSNTKDKCLSVVSRKAVVRREMGPRDSLIRRHVYVRTSFRHRLCAALNLRKYRGNMVFECLEGGQLYPNPFDKIKPKKADKPTPEAPKKPLWTRIAFAAVHVGIGGFVAAFLVSQRASWVRTMTVIRPLSKSGTAKPAQLYVEVAGHPRGYGHPLLIKDCALAPTKMNKDIMMILAGQDGKFAFHPVGSKIGGKQMPPGGDIAKINILKIWRELGGKIEYNPN